QVMRQDFPLFRLSIKEVCVLCLWEEIHGLRTIPEAYVGCNTHDLVESCVFLRSRAEVFPNRVLLAKEPLGKRLVDDGYRPRAGVVFAGDGPSHHDPVSESLEKSRRHTGPTG